MIPPSKWNGKSYADLKQFLMDSDVGFDIEFNNDGQIVIYTGLCLNDNDIIEEFVPPEDA